MLILLIITTNSYPLYDLENVERVTVIQTTMIPTGRKLQLKFERREDIACILRNVSDFFKMDVAASQNIHY